MRKKYSESYKPRYNEDSLGERRTAWDRFKRWDKRLNNWMGFYEDPPGNDKGRLKVFEAGPNKTVGVTGHTLGQGKAFITFHSKAGNALDGILLATAPLGGVQISQTVDYSVTKALGRDFHVATFGNRPVQIVLDGISVHHMGHKRGMTGGEIAGSAGRAALWGLVNPVLGLASGVKDYVKDKFTHHYFTIPQFYKENRVSDNRAARVTVGIAGLENGAEAFSCIVVGLELSAKGEEAYAGTSKYRLTLIGVNLK